MPNIIHRAREGFLKVAVVFALLAAARPSLADELLTGALRDQDGAVVAGAQVTALDASGGTLGVDRSAPDGTFALVTAQRPAALRISASESATVRVPVPREGPVTAVVPRYRSADRVPTVADVAALPAGSLGEIATTVPYWIAFPTFLGDRWLSRGRGVTTIEGMPFYRRTDGADASALLPTHAAGGITVRDPLQAGFYGDRAGGGVLDAQLFDRLDVARATNRDQSFAIGRGVDALFGAASTDAGGTRRAVAGRLGATAGSLSGMLVALAGDLPGGHYAGAGARVQSAGRAIDLRGTFDVTRDAADGVGVPDAGSVVQATIDASGRGPNAVAVRARWRDDRAVLGNLAAEHRDGALVAGTSRGREGGARFTAALALAYGADRGYTSGAPSGLAVLPSLAVDAPLGGGLSAHAGLGDATLGTPGFAIARASLGEAGLSFRDRRRLRFDVLAYAEGSSAPSAVTRGFAADLGWEIAPRLSLRAWSLRDGDVQQSLVAEYPGGPVEVGITRKPFRRDLLWLTWDAATRFDLLVRAGALEGSVRIPLNARYALTAGSARRLATGTRELSVGLTAR